MAYLGKKGYTIFKSQYTEKDINNIRIELNVKPETNQKFETTEYPIYRESQQKMYIPRYYGLNKFGIPKNNNLNDGLDCPNLIFNGTIRDIQKKPIENFIEAAKNPAKLGGIISVPCGFGKTIMSIYISCYFKKKTLFISHKDFLNEQFINSIKIFVPDARIGKIKQSKNYNL